MVRFSLVTGALILIAIGVFVALTGSTLGWAIAAFGVVDLLTVPLVMRMIERSQRKIALEVAAQGTTPDEEPEPPAADPTADPTYNPYARED
jgi:uncharacterized membrane protein